MNENELAEQFHQEMLGIYTNTVKECDYRPKELLRMIVEHGGLKAAKMLINSLKESEAFMKLRECERLDLTVEAYAIKTEFEKLFTEEERQTAKERLEKHGYEFEQAR